MIDFSLRSIFLLLPLIKSIKQKKIAASHNLFERLDLNNLTGVGRNHNNGIRKGLKDDRV
jgi:hypothetical protein